MVHACQRCGRKVTRWTASGLLDNQGLAFCNSCAREIQIEAKENKRNALLGQKEFSDAQDDPVISRAIAIAWNQLKSGRAPSFADYFEDGQRTAEGVEVVTRSIYTRAHRGFIYGSTILFSALAVWVILLVLALSAVTDQGWAIFGWYTGVGILPWILLGYFALNYEKMNNKALGAIEAERDLYAEYEVWLKELEDEEEPPDVLGRVRSRQESRHRLSKLTPRKFEEAVAQVFQRYGYDVELTPYVRDAGVDILLKDKDGNRHAVQVKQYASGAPIGRPALQNLQGAMLNAEADRAILLTLSHFSEPAIRYAKTHGIRLIDGDELIEMFLDLEESRGGPGFPS